MGRFSPNTIVTAKRGFNLKETGSSRPGYGLAKLSFTVYAPGRDLEKQIALLQRNRGMRAMPISWLQQNVCRNLKLGSAVYFHNFHAEREKSPPKMTEDMESVLKKLIARNLVIWIEQEIFNIAKAECFHWIPKGWHVTRQNRFLKKKCVTDLRIPRREQLIVLSRWGWTGEGETGPDEDLHWMWVIGQGAGRVARSQRKTTRTDGQENLSAGQCNSKKWVRALATARSVGRSVGGCVSDCWP